MSSLDISTGKRKFHLLVTASGPRDTSWAHAFVVRLSKNPSIETRAIVDDIVPRLTQTIIVLRNQTLSCSPVENADDIDDAEFYRHQAFDLVQWADLMLCVPLDADGISKMLAGVADTLLGEVLRGWDTSKSILLVPGMSKAMWANPMTKRQLSKIHRKWSWIRVISPITWHYEDHDHPKKAAKWDGFNEVLAILNNQAELLSLGRDADMTTSMAFIPRCDVKARCKLPTELWTIIVDYRGDWELATALGIYTNLPMPSSWTISPKDPSNEIQVYEHELEWTVLTKNCTSICKKLLQAPSNFDLSTKVIGLVIRFALLDVLSYLEANRPDLFKAFAGTIMPTKASTYFPRTDVLDFWKHSGWFRDNSVYDATAVDGASMNGHVDVLEWWWRRSGLPMRYTESALEQASANGHIHVLEWWQYTSAQDEDVVLRPGRSLLLAAQYGQVDVLRWWHQSIIPVAHDGLDVYKVASRWGHVEVLETWRRLKGDSDLELAYLDTDLLILPTIHQHVHVLDWWQRLAYGDLEGMVKPWSVAFRWHDVSEALQENGYPREVTNWWKQYFDIPLPRDDLSVALSKLWSWL